MTAPRVKKTPFPSAHEDARAAQLHVDSPQCRASSYTLAYQDTAFLLRDELRPVRLQLELLKPELVQQENQIDSTVVIFGSARIKAPREARTDLAALQAQADQDPSDAVLARRLARARRDLDNSRYYEEARRLGRLISRSTANGRMVVVTGGGPGIMEAANRGAYESGADSIGMNIVLPCEQAPNPYITPELCFQFHYFAIRKMHLLMRAKGLVAFPGGFGTLDELFETLTLIQTRKVTPIPVLLFGRAFWERVINFDALVAAGTISAADLEIFQFVETAREAWQIISSANGIEVPAEDDPGADPAPKEHPV
jgi:uncharacterized protein (TIGR00730 family)